MYSKVELEVGKYTHVDPINMVLDRLPYGKGRFSGQNIENKICTASYGASTSKAQGCRIVTNVSGSRCLMNS